MMVRTRARVFSTSNCAVRWARISNGIPMRSRFLLLTCHQLLMELACAAMPLDNCGLVTLYSICIIKGACFDVAVIPIGTLALSSCEWNVTSRGPLKISKNFIRELPQ